jgi:hypothetical protein
MQKLNIVILFSLISISINSQVDKNKLIGDWIKIKTLTLDGVKTNSKYGNSDDYLRFSFDKKYFEGAIIPYNKTLKVEYKIDHDTIELSFHAPYFTIPESYYYVEKLNDNELILTTKFENKDIKYFFINQKLFLPKLNDSLFIIDNDTIVIVKPNVKKEMYSAEYITNNAVKNKTSYYARPRYELNMGLNSFNKYLCDFLKFDDKLPSFELSTPIKVSFLINIKGEVSNVELLEGFNDYYDNQILRLIEKTNKDWDPTIIDNPNHYVKMIFTILIYNNQ